MSTHEILIAARKRIEKPENWCQNNAALDADGLFVEPEEPEACRWCMAGAIYAATRGKDIDPTPAFEAVEMLLAGGPDCEAIPDFNDSHSHSECVDLFDRAIAATKPD